MTVDLARDGERGAVEGLRAPFPWFGGKSRAADLIWERLGDVPNYIEPFGGSLAALLARPHRPRTETVNDLDCYLANFWRAVRAEPLEVARWADYPVSELDQNARHLWLVSQAEFRERMNVDPEFYDVKVAGWWVWGQNIWIGTGWCSERFYRDGDAGKGVHRQLPHLGDAGKGVHRQLPHLGDAGTGIGEWFELLCDRLRRVRICCGDWSRVLTPSVTTKHGLTGVLLDPEYTGMTEMTYSRHSSAAGAVRDWALEHGSDPLFRIALCGYEAEHDMPTGWSEVRWRQPKGYQAVREDGTHTGHLERIWFSPHCLAAELPLFRGKVGR